jgi:hypothetical protein
MVWLVWSGAALAVMAAIALVVLAFRARTLLSGQSDDPASRSRLTTLAAFNGAILGLGLMGVGLMVVGLLL